MKPLTKYFAFFLTIIAFAEPARAELIYGVTNGGFSPDLVSFDSANPGTSTVIGSTGVGDLVAIDFRPSTGVLYGLGWVPETLSAQFYTINITTGAATPLGAAITLTGSDTESPRVSMDFNPVVDLLRVVTANGTSYRINPNTGALVGQDSILLYVAGDPNAGANPPFIAGVAYSNNFSGASATTLYAYDWDGDIISRVGSIGGSPTSPDSGQMTTIGEVSGAESFTADIGFDISGVTGVAYVTFDDFFGEGLDDEFFTINLANGSATFIGEVTGFDLLDISAAVAVPEPATVTLTTLGLLGLAFATRRARR